MCKRHYSFDLVMKIMPVKPSLVQKIYTCECVYVRTHTHTNTHTCIQVYILYMRLHISMRVKVGEIKTLP